MVGLTWLWITVAAIYAALLIGAIWAATRSDRSHDGEAGDFRDDDPAHSYVLPA